MMRAVPYLRTSTDDKGQNPDRQLHVIREWAAREGVELLPAVVDEGTSATKTNPFQRAKVQEAIKLATEFRAEAIIVEMGDRWSRQGSKASAWAEGHLEYEFGLKLWSADTALKDQGTMLGDMVGAIRAELAKEWARQYSARVRLVYSNAQIYGTAQIYGNEARDV